MKNLLILDSNSIINRAFYGVRTLNAPDGTPTNAIYGFINILLKLINEQKPDYIFAAFDLKAPTFRHKMFDDYKANRKGMPDELAAQMPIMKDILTSMNIPILQLEGYEADDIIGTVSRICNENDIHCYIATGDRDDLQLANNKTTIILASTKMGQSVTELYDENTVKEKYNVTPAEFIDLKALMGDKSDNIPGVSGIGEKTAVKLICEYSTIEKMYDNIDNITVSARIKNNLINEKDIAFLSKKLATIDKNVPIDFDISSGVFDLNELCSNDDLYAILSKLSLKSIIKKLDLKPSESVLVSEDNNFFEGKSIICVDTSKEFIKLTNSLGNEISIYLKTENNNLMSVAVSDGKTSYYTSESMNKIELCDMFSTILADENIKKYTFAIKESIVNLNKITPINNVAFDSAIAAYIIDPSQSFDLESVAARYLGVYLNEESSAQISLLDDEETSDKDGKYAILIYELHKKLSDIIEENDQHDLYYKIELPLINVLASMQILGMALDTDELHSFRKMLSEKITSLENEIYEQAGETFNINSPKQLGVILFEKMNIPGGKKTKSGYSTRAEVLEKLKDKYPFVQDILEYRTFMKLKSTYCDGLDALVNPETHRIHSLFNQTATVTGRISSSEPNMQNIPTRTEIGRQLRKMFVAKEGCVLVDADYSQIELRILAHMSHDTTMIDAFKNNADIHAVTASKILNVPIEQLTKEQRSSAKAINFGIVYGMSEYTLSQDLKISFKQAKKYMDDYFNKYHGVRDYLNSIKQAAHEQGYVKTIMNRIRYIPELKSSTAAMRSFGERAAMNTPIQGSAADIIKLAMVKVYQRLKDENLKAKLILQVHDELIIETPENEAERVMEILQFEMENAVSLDVPLTVDISSGKSWYDAK